MMHTSAYRREGECWLIEIRLREVRQLFHHLDPAPFREKDLDPAAEAYIEDAVREIGPSHGCKLVVHLPATECQSEDARTLPDALAHYFQYRAMQSRAELRRMLTRGLVSLAIGLSFMFVCLTLRGWLAALGSNGVVTEGLLLIGWVFFVRSTLAAIGTLGLVLLAALFAAIVWWLVSQGWLDVSNRSAMAWVVLVILGLMLGVGMSWSHIRRRVSGQASVDRVDK